jgi:hypothetical protein
MGDPGTLTTCLGDQVRTWELWLDRREPASSGRPYGTARSSNEPGMGIAERLIADRRGTRLTPAGDRERKDCGRGGEISTGFMQRHLAR